LVESARASTLASIDKDTLADLAAILGIRNGLYRATASRELTQSQYRSARRGFAPDPALPDFSPVRGLGLAELQALHAVIEQATVKPTPPVDPPAERLKQREARRKAKEMAAA